MADQRDEGERGFKVHDRRRFSDTGEPREASGLAGSEDSGSAADLKRAGGEAPSQTAAEREARGAAAEGAYDDATRGRPNTGGFDSEINFPTFVISLSTQALAHLGEIPDPNAGDHRVDLIGARQLIDILAMLKEKTRGNLAEDEAMLLDHALYDLRMKYVECAHRR